MKLAAPSDPKAANKSNHIIIIIIIVVVVVALWILFEP